MPDDEHTTQAYLVERAFRGDTDPIQVARYGAWKWIAANPARNGAETEKYAWRVVQSAFGALTDHGCLKTADRAVGSSAEVAPDA